MTINKILTITIFIKLIFCISLNAQEQHNNSNNKVLKEYFVKLPFNKVKKKYTFEIIDGKVILDGDMIMGKLGEFENQYAIAIDPIKFRWPNSTIPFIVEPSHPRINDINWAINHINQLTNLRLVPHTDEIDFVNIILSADDVCSADAGRQGGEQFINIGRNCGPGGRVAHEILHAAGLWHEQSREDRNDFVRYNEQNVERDDPNTPENEDRRHNFEQHIDDGTDIGNYDYGSLMHYPTWAFSISNNQTDLPTLEVLSPPAPPNTVIGQRDALSQGDINAINFLYPKNHFYLQFLYPRFSPGIGYGAPIKNAHIQIMNSNTKKTDPYKKDYESIKKLGKFTVTRTGTFLPKYIDNSIFHSDTLRTDINGRIKLAFNSHRFYYKYIETYEKEYNNPSYSTEFTERTSTHLDIPDIYFILTVFNEDNSVKEVLDSRNMENGFFKNFSSMSMGTENQAMVIGISNPPRRN